MEWWGCVERFVVVEVVSEGIVDWGFFLVGFADESGVIEVLLVGWFGFGGAGRVGRLGYW